MMIYGKKKWLIMFLLEEPPYLSVSTYNSHLNLLTLEVVHLFIAATSGKGSVMYFQAKQQAQRWCAFSQGQSLPPAHLLRTAGLPANSSRADSELRGGFHFDLIERTKVLHMAKCERIKFSFNHLQRLTRSRDLFPDWLVSLSVNFRCC